MPIGTSIFYSKINLKWRDMPTNTPLHSSILACTIQCRMAWLHATILRVGFFDDFSEDEMLTVLHRLEPTLAAMKVPKLLLGQWWIWGGNPCVHFTPDEPLNAIFKEVLSEVSAVVGTDRLAQSLNFIPHITLAYSKTYSDKHGLFIQLQNQRIDAVPVRINRLSLIKQYVIDNYYAWDVIREIPVGQL